MRVSVFVSVQLIYKGIFYLGPVNASQVLRQKEDSKLNAALFDPLSKTVEADSTTAGDPFSNLGTYAIYAPMFGMINVPLILDT